MIFKNAQLLEILILWSTRTIIGNYIHVSPERPKPYATLQILQLMAIKISNNMIA